MLSCKFVSSKMSSQRGTFYLFLCPHSFFERDVNCVREMFRRKFGYESEDYPKFSDLVREDDLDAEVHCTGYGFTKEMEKDLLLVI